MTTLTQFARNQQLLQDALQRAAREERGEIPIKLQTPAERRRSRAKVRAAERSVERYVKRDRAYQKRTKRLYVGEY